MQTETEPFAAGARHASDALRCRWCNCISAGWLLVGAVIAAANPALLAAAPVLSTMPEAAVAKPLSLVWLTTEDRAANAQIVDVNDDTFYLIADALPNLQLQTQFVTMSNARALLKKQANSCTGNLMPLPERQAWGQFSKLPQVVFPGLRLYVRNNSPLQGALDAQATPAGTVSVAALLQGPLKFQLGYAADRSYGSALDQLLQKPEFQYKVWQRRSTDTASGVLQMFSRGRIDAVLEYPNVLEHYLSKQKADLGFRSYAITETPTALYGHLVCANGEQGQRIIQHIDVAMKRLVQDRRYLEAHLRWFSPELHPTVIKLYDQAYGTHFAKP